MASRVDVTYTAYEKGTNNIMSEGVMPVPGSDSWMAEQTVKAMFASLDVEIRNSRIVNS